MRSKNGKVNWHTGQETLKNETKTGPRFKSFGSEYSVPSIDFSEKSGALWPATIVVIFLLEPAQRESRCKIPMRIVYRKCWGARRRANGFVWFCAACSPSADTGQGYRA